MYVCIHAYVLANNRVLTEVDLSRTGIGLEGMQVVLVICIMHDIYT